MIIPIFAYLMEKVAQIGTPIRRGYAAERLEDFATQCAQGHPDATL